MSVEHALFEGPTLPSIEAAQIIADSYCKGLDAFTRTIEDFCLKEYFTVLKDGEGYYVTNRYDPRVVQWCEDNNVVPRGRVEMSEYILVETKEVTCISCVFGWAASCTRPDTLETCEQDTDDGSVRHFIYRPDQELEQEDV